MYMDTLRSDQFQSLLTHRAEFCISCYLPTFVAGNDIQQNAIRFKNIISAAEKELAARGLDERDAARLLDDARPVLNERTYWRHQGHGLAMFIGGGRFELYRLPYPVEEKVHIGDHFYVKPLIPLYTDDGRFYILALSMNSVRFYRSHHYFIQEINLTGMPGSLAEALRYDDPERQHQFHTHTGHKTGPKGRGQAIYHGHGVGIDERDTNLLRYCQKIDERLNGFLRDETAPLVLAAVDYLHPVFQNATGYRYVTGKGIIGNPEQIRTDDLRNAAWEIVQPYFSRRRTDRLGRYEKQKLANQASSDPEAVIPAASAGRVETLFVAENSELWGVFDADTNEVTVTGDGDGREDLLDRAVTDTFLNSGMVYAEPRASLPEEAPLAAIFRY